MRLLKNRDKQFSLEAITGVGAGAAIVKISAVFVLRMDAAAERGDPELTKTENDHALE